jgi:hypothetical protein
MNNTTNPQLKYILEFRTTPFYGEIEDLSWHKKNILDLIDALKHIDNNQKIPIGNWNVYLTKEEIQNSLAGYYRGLLGQINKLNIIIKEIQSVIDFFQNDKMLTRFVYLSKPVFTEAEDFEKGYAIVAQNSKKMYFTFEGKAYKMDTDESILPKRNKQTANPDLVPFKMENDAYDNLMGYKNSKGAIVIPAKFTEASNFVNGFAKVGIMKNEHLFYGLIDSKGQQVLPCAFIELGDVYNDVVVYKKPKYRNDVVQKWNFDWKEVTKYIGLLSGYLILNEVKASIFNELDKISRLEKTKSSLKTLGKTDKAHEQIK